MSADNPVSRAELQEIKDHIDSRFEDVNKWIEQCTRAITKLSEQSDRLVAVEKGAEFHGYRIVALETGHKSIVDDMKKLQEEDGKQRTAINRVLVVGGTLVAIASLIAPVVIKRILEMVWH